MYDEAPSSLVARISSTYLTMATSTVLYSVSLAYSVLHASHSASFQAFPVEADQSSLPASYFLFLAAANQFSVDVSLFSASFLATQRAVLYSANSESAVSKFNQAYVSSSQSSMMDYSNEALNSAIFSQTDYNFSAENVEASETRARIGFSPPILCNSARTASASPSGWMADNFEAITSKASTTFGVVIYLPLNASLSSALQTLKFSSYSFKMFNQETLFSISVVRRSISAENLWMSFEASVISLEAKSILLLYPQISASQSASQATWTSSASYYQRMRFSLKSYNILAISPRGDLFFIQRAMVSSNFFPIGVSSRASS